MMESKKTQTLLKLLLASQAFVLLIYTGFAVMNEGWTLFNVFVNNMIALNWSGQFNLDFSCYLTLSGLWIMWRNKFSISSIAIAVVAMIIGIMVFAPYTLYLLVKEKGSLEKLLLGERIN